MNFPIFTTLFTLFIHAWAQGVVAPGATLEKLAGKPIACADEHNAP